MCVATVALDSVTSRLAVLVHLYYSILLYTPSIGRQYVDCYTLPWRTACTTTGHALFLDHHCHCHCHKMITPSAPIVPNTLISRTHIQLVHLHCLSSQTIDRLSAQTTVGNQHPTQNRLIQPTTSLKFLTRKNPPYHAAININRNRRVSSNPSLCLSPQLDRTTSDVQHAIQDGRLQRL